MIVLLIQVAWVFKFLNSPVMPGGKLYIYIYTCTHTYKQHSDYSLEKENEPSGSFILDQHLPQLRVAISSGPGRACTRECGTRPGLAHGRVALGTPKQSVTWHVEPWFALLPKGC